MMNIEAVISVCEEWNEHFLGQYGNSLLVVVVDWNPREIRVYTLEGEEVVTFGEFNVTARGLAEINRFALREDNRLRNFDLETLKAE